MTRPPQAHEYALQIHMRRSDPPNKKFPKTCKRHRIKRKIKKIPFIQAHEYALQMCSQIHRSDPGAATVIKLMEKHGVEPTELQVVYFCIRYRLLCNPLRVFSMEKHGVESTELQVVFHFILVLDSCNSIISSRPSCRYNI